MDVGNLRSSKISSKIDVPRALYRVLLHRNILPSVIQFGEDLTHPRDDTCADPRGADMNAYFITR